MLRAALTYAASHRVFKYCQVVVLSQGVGAGAALRALAAAPDAFAHRIRCLSLCQPAETPKSDLVDECISSLAGSHALRGIKLLLSEAAPSAEDGGGEGAPPPASRDPQTLAQRLRSAWRRGGGSAKLLSASGYPLYGRARRFDGSRFFGEEPEAMLEVVHACMGSPGGLGGLWMEEEEEGMGDDEGTGGADEGDGDGDGDGGKGQGA